MFSLIDDTDQVIEVDGVEYAVNDSFDNILRMYEVTERYDNYIGVLSALYLLLGKVPEIDAEKHIKLYEKLIDIYVNEGEEQKVEYDLKGNAIPVVNKEWYSFKYDAWAIYAGFMQAYGIDLKKENGKLRWCNFKALLNGLPSETKFKQIIEIRQRPYPTGKNTSKEREELRKLKQELSYPGMDFSL